MTLQEGQTKPAADRWGTISAWAWGASRVIDYLETDDVIDKERVAITGASRLGKTVLWAAAKDERISSVFSVVPGAMGAALIRRDWGETQLVGCRRGVRATWWSDLFCRLGREAGTSM